MSQQFCTQCGTKLPEESNFCPQCGATVEGVAPQAASPPPPPPPAPPPAQPAPKPVQPAADAPRSGMSRTVLYVLGGVAIVALLAVVYFAFLRPGNAEPDCGEEPCNVEELLAQAQDAPASAPAAADVPYPDVARISAQDANARFEDGSAVFVDVRDRDSYTSMHIPGAVWIPLDEVNARHGELSRDAEILTYCT